MKTLKYLTICLVLFCMFTGNVFAVDCSIVIGIGIEGFIVGTDAVADVAIPGDEIYYRVTVARDAEDCGIYEGVVTLVTPDGASCVLDTNLALAPGELVVYVPEPTTTCGTPYTVSASDIGGALDPVGAGPPPRNVRAYAQISANIDSDTGPQSGGAYINKDTEVIAACVEVVKVPVCADEPLADGEVGEVVVGELITYDYTITNCSDPSYQGDLILVSIIDDTFDLSADIPLECSALPFGGSCSFRSTNPTAPAAPGTVTNTVEVIYDTLDTSGSPTGFFVSDTDVADVEAVTACLDVTVDCDRTEGGMAYFDVTVENCGTKALLVDIPEISFNQIIPGLTTVGPTEYGFAQSALDCGGTDDTSLTVDATSIVVDDICNLFPEPPSDSDSATCPGNPCTPSFTVDKTCLTSASEGPDCDLTAGDTADYMIRIENTSTCDGPLDLYFYVNDLLAEPALINEPVGPIAKGGFEELTISLTVPDCAELGVEYDLLNSVTVTGFCDDFGATVVDEVTETAICCFTCEEDGEGCTPGYWKNSTGCWCSTYAPEQLVSSVFGELLFAPYLTQDDKKSTFSTDSLMDALKYGGGRGLEGATRNMLRHATAALLNACNDEVYFGYSPQAVIDQTNAALLSKDIATIILQHEVFSGLNEQGCPISNDNAPDGIACQRHDEPVDPS